MNGAYTATVRQLLDIAPVVFTTPHFAIKGGTALNLFLHNLPRLSVDIDVVFTNHSLGREEALQAIATELSAISQRLEAMGYEVRQRRNSASNETRLMVAGPLAEVKVEVNEVFRGTLLPLQQRPLSPATEEEFAQAVTLPLLATAELYGTFLLSLVQNQPRWDCMPFPHLQELPAIRWKLQNLAKLKGAKRTEQIEGLQACFEQAGGPV
ncbi:nucleotidyl transferase AbiEii/AbiGii toxin family protein [Microcystis elabens FACHB-917]|nr:nucleotidyl transferase AbiEii/AbiGii toxin family protein [Microcystis elabens FACHB-917]